MGAPSWVEVLNDQSDWVSAQDGAGWFGKLLGLENTVISNATLERFMDSLCQMRSIVYALHFGEEPNFAWLKSELAAAQLDFDWPQENPSLPALRGKTSSDSTDGLLDSFRVGLILQFASELADSIGTAGDKGKERITVQRCEGLYRNPRANKISIVPAISEETELRWRKEIPVLVEESLLESDTEIQRCADLYIASSRSKYCAERCRYSTFQIIKQLKEPDYLAEKQRRYRKKKT